MKFWIALILFCIIGIYFGKISSQPVFAGGTQIGLVILGTGDTGSGSTTTGGTSTGSVTTGTTNTGTVSTGGNNGGGGGGAGVGAGSITPNPTTPPTITNPPITPPSTQTGSVMTGNIQTGVVLPTPGTPEEGIDEEMLEAYIWAKSKSITTKSTWQEARLFSPLLRAELAKMITNFVVNVMGEEVVDNELCAVENFIDNNQMNDEEKFYVRKACSLGLMGWKNDKKSTIQYFKPNGVVTRAEFGTVLSRFLYGDIHNGNLTEDGRYVAHLDALQSDNIMKKINQPLLNELRGYVMIMMKRIDTP